MALNVLIVDDDFINRVLLKTLLARYAVEVNVKEAQNGAEALDILEVSNSIDIILLDIMMPVIDGIEFLKIFRANVKNTNIPILVLSTDDSRKGEVFDNGANDFLRKPIKEDELFAKINQWTV